MRIGLIGGIYGKNEAFRRTLQITPETILENGFREKGHDVSTFSHCAGWDTTKLDVVHVHHLSYGAIRMAADPSNLPFVYTSHDGLAMSNLLGRARQLAAHLVMSRADAVVALSDRETAFQQRTYPVEGAIHTVIPNGIRCERYQYGRKNRAGQGRPWQLLFVGQLIEQKRIDLLLQALARLRHPAELDLVYHTQTQEALLRELANTLGVGDRVRFLGARPPHELCAIYQAADIFVLSSAGEALPSVVTEAMLCGTPVVVNDVGGVQEQVGPYGIVVPPGDPGALAAAIDRVLGNYSEFAARGEAMSRHARERSSIDNMVGRHLELYETLLSRNGPRRRHAASRAPVNAMLRMGVALLCATK